MRLLLPTLALLASCATQGRPVRFSSSPSGARIMVERRDSDPKDPPVFDDSGFVTPATLDLEDRPETKVELRLPGYSTAQRQLVFRKRREVVPWDDATVTYLTWRFPFWLSWETFWMPVRVYEGEEPSRVHVRLDRES